MRWSRFRKMHSWRYQVPPSVETKCFPFILTMPEMNFSVLSMVLSMDPVSARIYLLFGSNANRNQKYFDPTLINVSSIAYSDIILFEDIFWDWILLYPVPYCSMALLTILDNVLEGFIKGKPSKYRNVS